MSSIGIVPNLIERFSLLLYQTTWFLIKVPVNKPLTMEKGISRIKNVFKNNFILIKYGEIGKTIDNKIKVKKV
tara:strand:+ start:1867 stop:2085 length:219 start_codon:yes stop_codon:yes gene_type:complete